MRTKGDQSTTRAINRRLVLHCLRQYGDVSRVALVAMTKLSPASVTSVIETIGVVNYTLTEQPLGFSVNNYGYTWDRTINKITRRGAAGAAIPFVVGVGNVNLIYVAGMQVIPEDIQLGANALVKHLFRKGNTPVKSLLRSSSDSEVMVLPNYYMPNEVLELITPYALSPGIF